METTLTFSSVAALFGAMAVLAALPSASVLAVSARSASSGFVHGAVMALGIVVGDFVFILLAIFGLAFLAETLGHLFFVVKYAGGMYLIWLGIHLWKNRSRHRHGRLAGDEASLLSSFMTGLLITLGDQKAILFYLGFFPAFLRLEALSYRDVGLVLVVTMVAVGGVKVSYAYAADRAQQFLGEGTVESLHVIAAGIMVLAGLLVLVRS